MSSKKSSGTSSAVETPDPLSFLKDLDAPTLRAFVAANEMILKPALRALIAEYLKTKLAAAAAPPAPQPTSSLQKVDSTSANAVQATKASAAGGGGGHGGAGGDGSDGDGSGPALSQDDNPRFDPDDMHRAIIAIPLANAMQAVEQGQPVPPGILFHDKGGAGATAPSADNIEFPVIIDLNDSYAGGALRARQRVHDLLVRAILSAPGRQGYVTQQAPAALLRNEPRSLSSALPAFLRDTSARYVFANLYSFEIRELARLDLGAPHYRAKASQKTVTSARPLASGRRAIYRIWPSHGVSPTITNSVSTIKGDAAVATFGTTGRGIVWAVMDSGIDGDHLHFRDNENLTDLPPGVEHRDFTGDDVVSPLTDELGHGTHVAGIIAGEYDSTTGAGKPQATTVTWVRDDSGSKVANVDTIPKAAGVAPKCKLVSYKVLRGSGNPVDVRNVIAALEHVAEVNNFGRGTLKIHGVNMSLGYPFDPRWFACGESPICEVVNRLVRYGIFVVVAAGNTGHIYAQPTDVVGTWQQGAMMTVNDPGNAELAITVGSTHRDRPHQYGPSYFSSKGPTGDGRLKPDLLAPGEKILSCASADWIKGQSAELQGAAPTYREDSGTSMAAPHVSGAIAAFLSVRQEFVGRTDVVKAIFMDTATDLKRERYLQGRGVIDLLRALQSI